MPTIEEGTDLSSRVSAGRNLTGAVCSASSEVLSMQYMVFFEVQDGDQTGGAAASCEQMSNPRFVDAGLKLGNAGTRQWLLSSQETLHQVPHECAANDSAMVRYTRHSQPDARAVRCKSFHYETEVLLYSVRSSLLGEMALQSRKGDGRETRSTHYSHLSNFQRSEKIHQ